MVLYSITMSFNQVLASPVVFKDIHKCLLFTRKLQRFFWNIQEQIFKGVYASKKILWDFTCLGRCLVASSSDHVPLKICFLPNLERLGKYAATYLGMETGGYRNKKKRQAQPCHSFMWAWISFCLSESRKCLIDLFVWVFMRVIVVVFLLLGNLECSESAQNLAFGNNNSA